MPLMNCKNCNKPICSTGKNETTPWVHLVNGWVKCKIGVGKAEPPE